MECSNCHKESKNESKFCSQCGTSLGDAVQVASNVRERDLGEPKPIEAEEVQTSSSDKASGPLSSPKVLLSIVGGVLFLLFIFAVAFSGNNSGGSGGGDTSRSAFYDAGYNFGRESIGRNTDRPSAYNQCNGAANTVKFNNPNATNEELTDWVRGCMAYVAN
jgi:hypothetical protein